jgi:excinuclease ABC subunit C
MATENAVEALATLSAQWDFDANKQETALSEIKAALSLPNSPHRIECYDISNSHGTNATGSMVVFHRGNPTKSHYRRFTIRTISGQDDCASMREILSRRFNQWRDQTDLESSDPVQNTGQDNSFANIPDLLIVDGGKGQLGRTSLASKLEDIPGIGPIRRKALLRQFGSLNAIRDASFEEISRVRGISKTSAQSLKDSL